MASYNKITTLTEMKDYVLTQLGFPVLNIEVSDSQLEQAIIDSCQDFSRYNYDEGSYRDYFIFQATAGVMDYPVSSVRDFTTSATLDNVQYIWDFSVSFGLDGINTLFSPTHILLYDQYVNQGGYPGGPGTMGGTGLMLTNYATAMVYLEMINEMFGKMYSVDYIPGRDIIRITPTPATDLVGVLILWRSQYMQNIYNNPLVKKLAVARAGIRWIRNISKFTGTMPDGLAVNESRLTEYKEEEEKWLERMFDESEPPDFQVL
jgi:hypothetical protein